jgi:hypothetical protein
MLKKDYLQQWVNSWKEENLDLETNNLIYSAKTDLYCGPSAIDDLDYPGFSKATDQIKVALSSLRDLYISDWGEIVDSIIQIEQSYCEEDASFSSDYLYEEWTHFDKQSVIEMIVGEELASYVR